MGQMSNGSRWIALAGFCSLPLGCIGGTRPEPMPPPPVTQGPPEAAPNGPPAPQGSASNSPSSQAQEPSAIEAGRPPGPGPYARGIDVLAYDLEVGVSDTARWIEGVARLRVAVSQPPENVLALDFTGLTVERVSVDGRFADHSSDPGHLFVELPPSRAGTDTVVVEIGYRGVPDDGLELVKTVHGAPSAFADNWPNRARFWFPSVDHPSDKATVQFTIHAPASWEVVANGRLMGQPTPSAVDALGPPGNRRTWRWREDVPIPTYAMVFGATRFARKSVGEAACKRAPASPMLDGCVDVSYWVFPPDTLAASRAFRRAPAAVDYFTGLVAPFPYEKLANVQSATRFGGMENPSAIFYDQRALASGRDMEGTVVHEIAHQWFGDSVTEAKWAHLWLSEGFATYFTALFFQAVDGEERFRTVMEENRQAVVGSPVADRPVVDSTYTSLFDLLNANSYQKGAWVLHMLRGRLGDDAFFRGIRGYYRDHAHGTALTPDLEAAMEQASGEDLTGFFRQWVYQAGFPVLHGNVTWDAQTEEAVVSVTQEQPADWPTFHFDLTVELRAPGGPVRATLPVRSRSDSLRVPLSGAPDRLTLDPDGWLLKDIVR